MSDDSLMPSAVVDLAGPAALDASVSGTDIGNRRPCLQPVESPADPHRLARLFRDTHCRHTDGSPMLVFWQGGWMRWDTSYRVVSGSELRAELTRCCKTEFDRLNREELAEWLANGKVDRMGDPSPPPVARKVTNYLVNDITQALTSLTLLDGRVDHPAWLIKHPPFPATETVPFRNCLLHLPGYVQNSEHGAWAVAPTPAYFAMHSLNYDFDPGAPEPTAWLEFLHQLWPDDDQASIDLLQEWCGHLLTTDTSYQKILMLVGPRRSGKGTIARILRALLGSENTCNPTLSSLSTQFGLAPLIGRLAAIVTDARMSARSDMAQIVENLLSTSGEDSRTIDRKYLQPLTTNLYARFMLITNEVPCLRDASGALASRMLVLKLVNSFLGKEDRGLTTKLLKELPSILIWAVAGWKRLQERGHFIQPSSSRAEVDLIADLGSPVAAFLKECCVVGPEHSVAVQDLFRAWQEWCQSQNRIGGDSHRFGRDLRAVIPGLVVSQSRQDGKKRPRRYQGVGLMSPEN